MDDGEETCVGAGGKEWRKGREGGGGERERERQIEDKDSGKGMGEGRVYEGVEYGK